MLLFLGAPSKKKVFWNKKQKKYITEFKEINTWIGGRGSGKSTVIAFIIYLLMKYLPRSKTAFLCKDIRQAKTKSFPPITQMLKRLGLREHTTKRPGHYIRWKRPPEDWDKPHLEPEMYDNCITFRNGYCIEIVSQHRAGSARGGGYSNIIADETPLLDQAQYEEENVITMREPDFYFAHSKKQRKEKPIPEWIGYKRNQHGHFIPRLHQTIWLVGSMPHFKKQMWVLENELKAADDPKVHQYVESTAHDNIAVLGPEYLKRMLKTLTPARYAVEIDNKRPKKIGDCYYTHFDEDKQCYSTSYGNDPYYNTALPFEMSWDFNAGFECMVLGQWHESYKTLSFQRNFHGDETKPHTVEDVCKVFDEWAREIGHENRHIVLWGDANGLKRRGTRTTYFQQTVEALEELGWTVELMINKVLNPSHEDKLLLLQMLHSERNSAFPVLRYNIDHCSEMILSMQYAPLKNDHEKCKKNERGKTDRHTHTHYSDAHDYMVFWRFKHYLNVSGASNLAAQLSASAA